MIVLIAAIVGGIFSVIFILEALISFYKTFLRQGKNPKKLGKWAVVTGATDGIGKSYAMALAKRGMSIVLISRTEEKLKAVDKEINDKAYAGVETKFIVCDYSNFDEKARDRVSKVIKNLEVGVLVNNVGVSYPFPKFFHELTDEMVYNLMEMNISSTTWMTRMVIEGMVDRKRGAIINISSASGLFASPLLSQYSASKAYIEKFSRGLSAEYASKNITVQCQTPFWVATKLAKMRKSFTVPTPDHYVSLSMKWIGHSDVVVSPFWFHQLLGTVMCALPSFVADKIALSIHMSIRKKGMKKEAMKKQANQKQE